MLWKGITYKAINSLSLLIVLHLCWIFFSSIYAQDPIIAIKYYLAKAWYILPFYFLPFLLIRQLQDVRVLLKYFITGLLIGSLYFFYQHLQEELSFLSRTNAGQPIWRNHVNYACTLVISLPMLIYLYRSSHSQNRWIYGFLACLFLIFIYFSFARVAYVCILAGIMYTIILKWKKSQVVLVFTIIITLFGLLYVNDNNRYLNYAPEYERAIMQLDFERKISATATGEDVSTMERLHRWVAGQRMLLDHPITGVGPGNFYNSYKPYTIFSFETYVSNNPDRSGIHNHYLMILAEQGIPGFVIWMLVLTTALLSIEKRYHLDDGREEKLIYWLAGCIISMILVINLVNDMIEVVKIGSIFFLMLAVSRIFPNVNSQKIS